MNIERFEASLRLGIPFDENWRRPDLADVRLEMFRKRGKPLAWRPIIDPHIFLFYDSYKILRECLEAIEKEEISTPYVKRDSFRAYWFSGKRTEAFTIAREILKDPAPRIFSQGIFRLLLDIEEFRKAREDSRIAAGFWNNSAVGAALMVIDLDSFPYEELDNIAESPLLESLLFRGLTERIFLCLVAKDASKVPIKLLPFVEFGCFVGQNEKFVEPFKSRGVNELKPLIYRDSLGKFFQAWSNEIGDLYNRRYSLNEEGQRAIQKENAENQAFVDWIRALDDGS